MTLQEREAQACAIIDNLQDELKEISLFLHDNPELGQAEFKALEKISQYMTDKGFITQVGLTGRPELRTAMRSDKNIEGNHKMAFLGEYDALPELGHGCGHNLIAIMSMGAAIALAKLVMNVGVPPFSAVLPKKLSAVRYIWRRSIFLMDMRGGHLSFIRGG